MKTTDITSSSKLVASVSNFPNNDIPPARRQPTEISLAEIESIGVRVKPQRRGGKRFLAFLCLAGIAGVGAWQWNTIGPYVMPSVNAAKDTVNQGKQAVAKAVGDFKASRAPSEGNSPANTAVAEASPRRITITKPGETPLGQSTSPANATGATPSANPIATGRPDELLNHRRYDVAEASGLVRLNPNSDIKLKPAAQAKLIAMIAKAQADGVRLGVVSGFRSLADQDYLYFEVKAERGESAETRAEVSAPPGYSEHHTGYAVDLIDESQPSTHVEESFTTTPAFKWLQKNAAFYNFEMSFPKDPSSPVGYEPWHWRYVGNQESLELFYKD